jgi:hypothetical protein
VAEPNCSTSAAALSDRIAHVSEFRQALGYVYEPDKFGRAGMTRVASDTVRGIMSVQKLYGLSGQVHRCIRPDSLTYR